MRYLRYTLVLILIFSVSPGFAVHPVEPTSKVKSTALSSSMTINQFLSIDAGQIRKSHGIKHAWIKRWTLRHAQHRLSKKLVTGELKGETRLDLALAKGGDPNKRGKFALIFAGAGFLFLFLGPLAYLTLPLAVAGLILGIIGVQKDRDRTMAIIGIVLGGLTLLIFLLALLIVLTFLGLF